MRRIVPALIAVIICLSPSHVLTQTAPPSTRTRAGGVSAQQLKRDLDAMKQQMQQMQQGGAYNLLTGQYAFNYSGDASLPNIYLYRLTMKGFTFAKPAITDGFVV